LPKYTSAATVSEIDEARFSSGECMVNVNLKSQTSEFVADIAALVAPTITDNQLNITVSSKDWKLLAGRSPILQVPKN